MRDPRRNPVPARYRYPRKADREAGGNRRRWTVIGAGVLALVIVVGVGAFFMLRESSPPIDPAERAAVESFTRAVLEVEARRKVVATEFEGVGRDIRTTEFSVVFRILESVIPKQEHLAEEVESLESPSNVTALAQTLFIDAYEKELEGYKMLNRVAGQAQATFPDSTARRLRRFDGYSAAVSRLNSADSSRVRAFEELDEVLRRVGMSLEEVRSGN